MLSSLDTSPSGGSPPPWSVRSTESVRLAPMATGASKSAAVAHGRVDPAQPSPTEA